LSYYRRYQRHRNWGAYHSSERARVTSLFGGIDKDVEIVFFSLPSFELEALFREYGFKYGLGAESYARNIFPKWKSGVVKLSGQTAERLIELLPPRLNKEQRYELIRKLRNHYIRKLTESVYAKPESWRESVIPVIKKVVETSRNLKLPEVLFIKASWLADGDSRAAQNILRSIEEEEARQRTSYLEAEFKRIEIFMTRVENTTFASHTISLPQGDIHVIILKEKQTLLSSLFSGRRQTMSNKENDLITSDQMQKALMRQQARGSLLNLSFADLNENQKIELRKKIIEEKLGLDVSQEKADQRFYNSTRDMANTINVVRGIEQSSKSDYDVRATFETASGSTNVTVKKSNNTVIIVVAIVIGIIIFLFLRN
jgi:hypothetical protein